MYVRALGGLMRALVWPLILAVCACWVVLVWAAPAVAAPTWLSPVDVSLAGQSALEPQVAIDAAGDAVAVWDRSNGANTIVQAAARPAGGSFGAPVDLSVAGGNALVPQVAIDPAGDAVAVWTRFNGSNVIVQAAARPAGGSFGAPVDLSLAGQNAIHPQVAIDAGR